MDVPLAEVLRYGGEGKVRAGAIYYDQVTMLTQLGHMPPQGKARAQGLLTASTG
jgi:hypothetical protein